MYRKQKDGQIALSYWYQKLSRYIYPNRITTDDTRPTLVLPVALVAEGLLLGLAHGILQ